MALKLNTDPPSNHKQESGREQFGVSRVDLEDADDNRRSLAALDPSPAPMAWSKVAWFTADFTDTLDDDASESESELSWIPLLFISDKRFSDKRKVSDKRIVSESKWSLSLLGWEPADTTCSGDGLDGAEEAGLGSMCFEQLTLYLLQKARTFSSRLSSAFSGAADTAGLLGVTSRGSHAGSESEEE